MVGCFPQNDRAQITRLAPRWIEQAYLLHEGDEAALCALAGIRPPSGPVRLDSRRNAARTAVAEDVVVTETALVAYWQRESWLRLLCAPLLALALLLFLLLLALLGLISARPPWPPSPPYPSIIVPGGNNSFRIMASTSSPSNGSNSVYWQYGPYGPYPSPYPPPYPPPNPGYYPQPYPVPYPMPYPGPPGGCCPTCGQQPACPPAPPPTPTPTPTPDPDADADANTTSSVPALRLRARLRDRRKLSADLALARHLRQRAEWLCFPA